MTGSQSNFLKS